MPHNTKSVCIIDDDNMYINLVSKILELKKLSESVIVFKNGKEALDFFITSIDEDEYKSIPQVIFLDLNMPIMDGWEFLQEFDKIKDKIDKQIDLYVVSSSIDSRDIDKAKSIDLVSDYLTKPIKLNDFEKILV
ncbi:Response regulator receiver domain-containing protein [Aquimarina amphilecti]|uniref:Response regulator receiver domain-containing protein n=1 Tax=Aquimarina amphilecti TaxID=1038014 RepID=A0A1H7KIC9_AQUAM|nr:response regulator [Aquimarina amphilecti]SEK86290.1 Response regulator receiver domain-containing protein [Aquimarina amphilecti]